MAKEKKKVGEKLLSPTELKRRYSGTGKASEIYVNPDENIWLPSRNIVLNYTLGGGIPYGSIMEIFGTESSGKTLMALDFGAVAQSLGGVVLFEDAEQAFTPEWAEANGLDLENIELWNETSIERISDWLADMAMYYRSRLKSNEPILFICDSIAALDCEDNINSAQLDSKAEMGNRAKAIYKMLRTRNQMLNELGVCSIFINQIRKKLDAQFEDPDTVPGGQAMRFYARQRLGIYAGKQIKAKIKGVEQRVGNETSVRVKKNKVAPPRETFKTSMYFNPEYHEPLGFDRYQGIADLLISLKVMERSGAYYKYEGNSIAQGEAGLLLKLKQDGELRKKLLNASGINTVSKTRAKLDSLTKNLFPVNQKSSILDDDE